MRKAFVLAAVSAAAVLSAATAQAAIYTVHIDGQIIQQLTEGSDPRFGVGTPVTLDTVFDSDRIVQWGDSGYDVAFLWNHSASYVIDLAGLKTYAGNEYHDGSLGFTSDLKYQTPDGPQYDHRVYSGLVDLIFREGKIVSATGSFVPGGDEPGLKLGQAVLGQVYNSAEAPGGIYAYYSTVAPQNTFVVGENRYLYNNIYSGPQFLGQWDFDNATITIDPVPEPAAWALMIMGFGLVGSAIRRRRTPAAA